MQQQQRAYWLKTLHQWHWISSALCLLGILVFSFTGITLNHASQIEAKPRTVKKEAQLPASLVSQLNRGRQTDDAARTAAKEAPLPESVRDWLTREWSLRVGKRSAEWSDGEIYLALPRPGGDAWLSIDLQSGAVEYETTSRGWLAYLNDLHKGRNTGPAWGWFIDLLAIACLIFSITGFFLLQMHARQRALTWPMVALGLVVPVVLALLFIH